jgi:hypothetical protein
MQNDKTIKYVQRQLLSPDGPETVFVPPGEYVIVETIVVPLGRKLLGRGVRLIADESVSPVILAEPGVKVEDIQGFKIQRKESFKI